MRVILANKFFYPRGGDCIHTISLKSLLEEKGHEVAIFSMQYSENIENEYSEYWPSSLDYSSKNLSNIKEAVFRPIYSKEVKTKWIKLLNDFKPDVVHLHNIHTQLSPILAECASVRKIKVFWTLHDYKLICPSYSLMKNACVCEECLRDRTSVVKNKCIKGSVVGSLIGYLESVKWSKKRLEKYTTSFISPSIFLKNKMVEAGFSSSMIEHIYNFAELNKFKANIEKENFYVYLGRLSREKGVETLLRAAHGLTYKLKIIGDGPLRFEFERKYASENIEFLGFKQWDEIKDILGKAKFMLIPSEWYENNPLSIIESLALGTPVLGANIGGIPELIGEGNGMLFESKNVIDLSEKIELMMSKRDWDYQEISNLAKEKFSIEIYYKKLMKLYNL